MSRRKLPRALTSAVAEYVLDPSEVVYDQTAGRPRFGNGQTPGGHFGSYTDDFAENLDDHITEANASNPTAVFDGISEAILRAQGRTRRIVIPSAYTYAQPNADITLNDIEIIGPLLTRPAYSATTNYMARFAQTDMTRPIFKIGKNVHWSGVGAYSPDLTDAAAQAAITAAGAVTDAQKKAALDGLWGGSSALFVPQDAGNMEFCTFTDMTVERCWKFMQLGNVGQYQSAGKIDVRDVSVFSVSHDFLGKQCAELCTVSDSFFGFGVAPDYLGVSSPLRDYVARNGVFFENSCGASYYPSFDGFCVANSFIFGKRAALLALSGRLDISRWSNIQTDATSFALYLDTGGQITGSDFEFKAYSYRSPLGDADPDYATKPVILVASTQAAAPGASNFTVRLKSQFSNGPVVTVSGDHFNQIDLPNLNARNFSSGGAGDAVIINNTNAVVTAPDMVLRASFGNTTDSGIAMYAGRLDSKGAIFDGCNYAVAQTGGILNLDSPTSLNTVTRDVIRSGGALDVRSPRWSNPGGLAGNCAFKAAGSAQTFNSGTATVKTFATEVYDHHADFASNAFTAPLTGPYSLSYSLTHDATGTAGDRWLIQVVKNGAATIVNQSYVMVANVNTVTLTADVYLVAGDVVDIRVARVGGAGNFVTISDDAMNWFAGRYIYG